MLAELAADREILYLEPGHLLVCTEPCRLRTVLGSCVSVCLYDPELRHGGMNHFMLPESPSSFETSCRYGTRAMPMLLSRLERLGSDRRSLCASVFGGACVLFGGSELMHLGRRNVDFALGWLEDKAITVVKRSVLGDRARRLELDVESGACTERLLGGA
jgi:chemotaxis receptor (MCP) glutamine deamidase CheD